MDVTLTFLILVAPFATAAVLSWTSSRSHPTRKYLASVADDRDWYRIQHDADLTRSHFEHNPAWPVSGVMGERR